MSMDSDPQGLRLMVYDRSCRGRPALPGLSHAWWAGAHLYRSLGRLDAYRGVDSWDEALEWLASVDPTRPLAEVQYWGHGNWGSARVRKQRLDRSALEPKHSLHARLAAVRDRMLPDARGLWWFRTCETFGARPGQRFASELADFLGARVAGHTFIIGHIQSGLHTLAPGQRPYWDEDEGLREGSPEVPLRARWSRWKAPNTITCLRGTIPHGY
ncbi:hypothetical protein [Paraliomyxa miuraensis]|uniref:hypothetical protein n=1 Tax=Paraliomyxa miuraensis TaxID=376150 RepID=UPI00225B0075|nr:hypothetical protein [Paraliomyxa miuraensis]MCX4242204.1 hypothetical protein [Paraliomyxa miuraensis]